MHPAYSVIVFTVASGAGFGMLALLGLSAILGLVPTGAAGWSAFGTAFALTVGGLLCSTLHLRHPERAWRALSQWRSSWLSREGVFAVAALVIGAAFALSVLLGYAPQPLLGALTAALAIATIYSTAMIYAQLRAVRRWHRKSTVLCYLIFAVAGGALCLAACLAAAGSDAVWVVGLAGAALASAWLVKFYWWNEGGLMLTKSTPESATGLGRLGKVRLFDPPHTGENYLTKEMGFRVARKHADQLRRMALLLGGVVPLVFCIAALAGILVVPSLLVAVISHLAGMLIERWLFFAEAEHAVMNYYYR